MKILLLLLYVLLDSLTLGMRPDEILFQDDFKGKLGHGWSWVREHREAWRVTPSGLEVRLEPGNMWGPQNNASNLLVRLAPAPGTNELQISVNVENHPSNQYEQVDLVWYYDDGNMVKLGQELVDGQLSVVMGREEKDKTRTVSITPLDSNSVQLRILVKAGRIRGQFRTDEAKDWRYVGQCDLPAPENGTAHISLQFYQGLAEVEHWARITAFRILRARL
jgi:hypothetical protein